jgi:hypothetical protein
LSCIAAAIGDDGEAPVPDSRTDRITGWDGETFVVDGCHRATVSTCGGMSEAFDV